MAPADIVHAARARQGISTAQLAVRADCPEATIRELEAGIGDVDRALLERLLLVMGEHLVIDADGAWRPAPLARPYDRGQLAELQTRPPAERLRHALGWNMLRGADRDRRCPRTRAATMRWPWRRDPGSPTRRAAAMTWPWRRRRDPGPATPPEAAPQAPTDPERVLAMLDAHGVEYLVIGGVAVQAHGHLRTTLDLDILAAPAPRNLERLGRALAALEARLLGVDAHLLGIDPTNPRDLAGGANFTLATVAGRIDVWTDPAELKGARPLLSLPASGAVNFTRAVPPSQPRAGA